MYPLRLLAFLGPYKRRAALAFLCVIASGGAILAMPQIIRWAIDYGLGPEEQNGELVATGEKHLLLVAAVAIVGAAVFRGVFACGRTLPRRVDQPEGGVRASKPHHDRCSAFTPITTNSRPAS
jgi:hypothetical protein